MRLRTNHISLLSLMALYGILSLSIYHNNPALGTAIVPMMDTLPVTASQRDTTHDSSSFIFSQTQSTPPSITIDFSNLDKQQQNRTMILMSDSRALNRRNDYHTWAYAINAHYAHLHGYRIRYYQTPCIPDDRPRSKQADAKNCIACRHPEFGPRMSPWCKLVAINNTLHRYKDEIDRLVYLDSDAFVQNLPEPLPDHYFHKTLGMFWNKPWPGVCSGIQFWHNSELGRQVIAAWWNSKTSFHLRHDYEQSVFRQRDSPLLQNYGSHLHVIQEDVRENRVELQNNPFFRHITRKKENARLHRMMAFARRHNVSAQP